MSEPTWPQKKQETVLELFNLALTERPDDIFIDMVGDTRTFRQVEHEANGLAHGLQARGVKTGDTVCGLTDTSMDSLVIWFAVNKLGAIWVPINSALKGEFLRHQIEDCGAKLMVADSRYVERVQLIAERLKTLEVLYVRGDTPAGGAGALKVSSFETLRNRRTDTPEAEPVKPRDLSLIIYTSGTTGRRKDAASATITSATMRASNPGRPGGSRAIVCGSRFRCFTWVAWAPA